MNNRTISIGVYLGCERIDVPAAGENMHRRKMRLVPGHGPMLYNRPGESLFEERFDHGLGHGYGCVPIHPREFDNGRVVGGK